MELLAYWAHLLLVKYSTSLLTHLDLSPKCLLSWSIWQTHLPLSRRDLESFSNQPIHDLDLPEHPVHLFLFFFIYFLDQGYLKFLVCVCVCVRAHAHLVTQSHVRLFATSWTVTCQTPLSMGFSRQEYWSE